MVDRKKNCGSLKFNSKALVTTTMKIVIGPRNFDAENSDICYDGMTGVEQDDWSMSFDAEPYAFDQMTWILLEHQSGLCTILPTKLSKDAMISPKQTWKPNRNFLESVNRVNGSYTLKQFEAIQKGSQGYAIIDCGCSWKYDRRQRTSLSDFMSSKVVMGLGNDSKDEWKLSLKNDVLQLGSQEYYSLWGNHLFGSKATEMKPVPYGTERLGHVKLQKYQQLVKGSCICKKIEERTVREPSLNCSTWTYWIAFEEEKRKISIAKGKEQVDSTFTLSTANTPPQSTGNTPTDSDDDTPTDGVFSTNSFDAEEGGSKSLAKYCWGSNKKKASRQYFKATIKIAAKVSQALADESWVEVSKRTQLQFKLQQEYFATVARIEAIRLFLAFASFMASLSILDGKRAFLYGNITEKCNVKQPPGLKIAHPNKATECQGALMACIKPQSMDYTLDLHLFRKYVSAMAQKKNREISSHSRLQVLQGFAQGTQPKCCSHLNVLLQYLAQTKLKKLESKFVQHGQTSCSLGRESKPKKQKNAKEEYEESKEVDLETTQSTAKTSTNYSKTLNCEDEADLQAHKYPFQFQDQEFEHSGSLQSQPHHSQLQGTILKSLEIGQMMRGLLEKIEAEWDAEKKERGLAELKKTKPKTTLRKPTSHCSERNLMMRLPKKTPFKNCSNGFEKDGRMLKEKMQKDAKEQEGYNI
ncbi:putative ribonuclease H-like domain-containing protein [Tanacetum coccineum]|uniref:Ribonuclease H-like domain-containing protein n=1 Tax=Tanacetum coccineum TaxID=301880 RepID=A0ABQ4WDE8_9ASTR